jgi:hypothetical protein
VIIDTHPKAFSNHDATGVIRKMPKKKTTNPTVMELPVVMWIRALWEPLSIVKAAPFNQTLQKRAT